MVALKVPFEIAVILARNVKTRQRYLGPAQFGFRSDLGAGVPPRV
ncbi:MAG: hypothetical protein ACJASV_002422 [Pseudorhodobacter sp.]|jgi:hypothetical protein